MKLITLDFETYYDADYSLKKMSTSAYITDPRFRCLGFAVKVDDKPAKWVPESQVASWLAAAKPFLESNMVLAHHAHFDGAILNWHYGIKPKAWLDTLCMAKGLGLNATVGGSLLALCKHFEIGQKPDLRPDSTPEEVELRGTWDADATYKLFRILSKGYPAKEYKLIDLTVREFTQPLIHVDVPMLTAMADKLDAAKDAALAALGVDAAELGSPALFCSRLESLGVEVEWKKTPAGNTIPAIAKTDDFMAYLLEHENETVQALAAARLGNKSTGDGTRARTFIRMAEHGAIPVYYNYYGAHPGRWSGGDGTNFANLKRGGVLRDAILAPDWATFVVGDLAQIEARLTAALAGEDELVEAFRDKRDVYCEFGSYAFRRPITKADEFERFTSKFWVLGGGFGMGAAKGFIQTKAEINKRHLDFPAPTQEQCQAMVDAYRAKYAAIPKLWKRMEWLIAEPGREIGPLTSEHEAILLPNGMRLRYPNLKWESYADKWGKAQQGYRYDSRKGRVGIWGGKFTQNCIEALARIILADAMLALKKKGFAIPLHLYDEITLCVPDESVANAKMEMERAMTQAPEWMPDLPLAVEIGVGKRYGDCK
jgi:hypothetical protein